jgi:hypothetical protein
VQGSTNLTITEKWTKEKRTGERYTPIARLVEPHDCREKDTGNERQLRKKHSNCEARGAHNEERIPGNLTGETMTQFARLGEPHNCSCRERGTRNGQLWRK